MTQEMRPTVLVVDDTVENIEVLLGILRGKYRVRVAKNGELALRQLQNPPYPDLILLDIMMPGMDGYEVCKIIKQNDETRSIPVIFVTAMTQVEDEIKGFNLGAVDYITKPFSPPVVLARVENHLALREARQALEETNSQLNAERELVENIILRMRAWKQYSEINMRSLVAPVEQSNGDILLSYVTPSGSHYVLLGDFTGHGLPAAVAGPLVSYIFYSLVEKDVGIEVIFTRLNEILQAQLPVDLFMAATLIHCSADRGKLSVINAGMEQGVLIRNGSIELLVDSALPPLGIIPGLNTEGAAKEIAFQAGDRFYAYSDGAVEAKSPGVQGEMFGAERLRNILINIQDKPLDDVLDHLETFCQSQTFPDDITMVEVTT